MDRLFAALLSTSPLEALAVALGFLYSVLAVRQQRACWLAGGLSSLLFVYLAGSASLPMQAGLQAYYVVMAVYGWLRWSPDNAGPRVSVWPLRNHCIAIAIVLLVSLPVSRWIAGQTQAAWPYLDTVTSVASLLATWLIAQRKLENWLYWIAIDSVLAFLFAAQGLVFSAALFVAYLGVSVAGYFTWLRRLRQELAE